MKNRNLFLAVLFCCSLASTSPAPEAAAEIPAWLQNHFEFMVGGSGRWITSNAPHKNENEPFDEYGTQWTWGVGKKSIHGRLFGLADGKQVASFWEYRVFWHPEERRAVFLQFGSSGVFGTGEMRVIESTGNKHEFNVELDFYAPDGSKWKDLHKLVEDTDQHTTRSFLFKDGVWKQQRTYVWQRAKPE